jgi:hypothetical protein
LLVVDRTTGLASLGLDNSIRLRWVLRDIRADRLRWSPATPEDVQTLVDMGYVARMDEGKFLLSTAGIEEMDKPD